MSDLKFEGGILGDGRWTLLDLLDGSADRIIVIGPTLNYLAQNQNLFWSKISSWLVNNPERSLQLLIEETAEQGLHPETLEHLRMSKRIFRSWLENALSFQTPLKLSVKTLRAKIRAGVTIVNPDCLDATAVVVPLIYQQLPGGKFYVAVKRKEHPEIFTSIWHEVSILLQKARPLKRSS